MIWSADRGKVTGLNRNYRSASNVKLQGESKGEAHIDIWSAGRGKVTGLNRNYRSASNVELQGESKGEAARRRLVGRQG